MHTSHDTVLGAIVSYTVVGVANVQTDIINLTQELNWMAVGAAVLLVARLVQDVPRAFIYVLKLVRGKPNVK